MSALRKEEWLHPTKRVAMRESDPKELAKTDLMHHVEHGVDLNPYSTVSARRSWNRGFVGAAMDVASLGHEYAYERGKAAWELLNPYHNPEWCVCSECAHALGLRDAINTEVQDA